MKSPLYPMFLAAFIKIFAGVSQQAIVVAQHIMIGFVPLLIYKSSRIYTDKKNAFFASLLFMLHISYFYYPNVIEATNLFVPIFAVYFYLLLLARTSQRYISLAITGGLLVLLQPTIIPVLIFSAVFLRKNLNWTSMLKIVLIISLMQLPWIYRNYASFDKFIPTKSPFWMNLYIGILPESQENSVSHYLGKETIQTIDSLKDKLNDVDMEIHYKHAFLSFWEKSPERYLEKVGNHLKYYWILPPRYIDNLSLPIIAVRLMPNIALLILTLLGLKRAYHKDKSVFWFIISILVYFSLVYSLTAAVNIRYKLDIEFLQVFLASFGLIFIVERNNIESKNNTQND
jgi:hypothetical protein